MQDPEDEDRKGTQKNKRIVASWICTIVIIYAHGSLHGDSLSVMHDPKQIPRITMPYSFFDEITSSRFFETTPTRFDYRSARVLCYGRN